MRGARFSTIAAGFPRKLLAGEMRHTPFGKKKKKKNMVPLVHVLSWFRQFSSLYAQVDARLRQRTHVGLFIMCSPTSAQRRSLSGFHMRCLGNPAVFKVLQVKLCRIPAGSGCSHPLTNKHVLRGRQHGSFHLHIFCHLNGQTRSVTGDMGMLPARAQFRSLLLVASLEGGSRSNSCWSF